MFLFFSFSLFRYFLGSFFLREHVPFFFFFFKVCLECYRIIKAYNDELKIPQPSSPKRTAEEAEVSPPSPSKILREAGKELFDCEVCGRKTDLRCSGCSQVFYCSRDCSSKHAFMHKDECVKGCSNSVADATLVNFVLRTHGFAYPDFNAPKHSPRALAFVVQQGDAKVLRGAQCLSLGGGGDKCNCTKAKNIIAQAAKRNSSTESVKINTPFSSLHLPPTIEEYLRKLREENKTLTKENEKLRKAAQEELEKGEKVKIQSDADNHVLVRILTRVLESNVLQKDHFIFHFLQQQLQCVDTSDARGFRWDTEIVHWALTIQFYGGKLVLSTLRGRSTEGLGKKFNVADWD